MDSGGFGGFSNLAFDLSNAQDLNFEAPPKPAKLYNGFFQRVCRPTAFSIDGPWEIEV